MPTEKYFAVQIVRWFLSNSFRLPEDLAFGNHFVIYIKSALQHMLMLVFLNVINLICNIKVFFSFGFNFYI